MERNVSQVKIIALAIVYAPCEHSAPIAEIPVLYPGPRYGMACIAFRLFALIPRYAVFMLWAFPMMVSNVIWCVTSVGCTVGVVVHDE